jgi:ATP-dependent DNA helicase RecQ
VELEVKKMAPDGAGAMRKIPDDVRISPGWSLSRLGDGGWWPAVERGLSEGTFDAAVIAGLADLLRSAGVRVDWITSVPSVRLGDTLVRLGERLAGELAIPHLELVARREQRPPQREMANAVQQAANVRGAFKLLGSSPPGTGILLDDERISGWTLAMVGGQLRRAGAERIVPLALGTLA